MVVFGRHNRAPAKAAPIDKPHRRNASNGDRATIDGPGSTSCRTLRVLIVDHQQDAAAGLFSQVGRWGHASQMAYHGHAALIAAAEQPPDVVLLNLELPSMDGRPLARQLRLDSPQSDYFIIAFADWADDQRRRECSEAGIDLLLVKSVDPSVLEMLLGLEWVRLDRQRAAEADKRTSREIF